MTTSIVRVLFCRRPLPVRLVLSLIVVLMSLRAARQAGSTPKIRVVSNLMTTAHKQRRMRPAALWPAAKLRRSSIGLQRESNGRGRAN